MVLKSTEAEDSNAGTDNHGHADADNDMSEANKWYVCRHTVCHRLLTASRAAAIAIGRKAQQKAEVKRKNEMGATEVEDANAGTEGNGNTEAGDEELASKKLRIDASGNGNAGA